MVGEIVDLPDKPTLTPSDIAGAIGCTREQVSRSLRKFRLRRIVGVGREARYSRPDVLDWLEDSTHDPRVDREVMNPEWREKVARRKRELRANPRREASGIGG